jgi:hypothetical protein
MFSGVNELMTGSKSKEIVRVGMLQRMRSIDGWGSGGNETRDEDCCEISVQIGAKLEQSEKRSLNAKLLGPEGLIG